MLGTAYFGWILGATLFTQLVTPLPQALAALCPLGGGWFGIASGAGLGLARSVEPWMGALTRKHPAPAVITEKYVTESTHRIPGLILAAGITVISVLEALR